MLGLRFISIITEVSCKSSRPLLDYVCVTKTNVGLP